MAMTEADKVARYGLVVCRVNSKSDPGKKYAVRQKEGSLSCNCKGWIFNRATPKRCRHTDAVPQGEPSGRAAMRHSARRIIDECGLTTLVGAAFDKFVTALLREFGGNAVATGVPTTGPSGGGTLLDQPVRLITLED